MVTVVGTVNLQFKTGESKLKVVFSVLRYFAVPALLGTFFIGRFAKFISLLWRKTIPYNSKPAPTLTITKIPEELKDKVKHKVEDVVVIEQKPHA